jgi:Predicted RNA-binding protein
MLREAIATGENVEVAFQNACRELGVDSSEASFEILETPVKKTLGLFGGSPAKVRAYIEESNPAQEASKYLISILNRMGLEDVEIEIKEVPEGAELILSGGDIGFIIGHRGETLDALQYLASLVANHVEDKYFRITLDVGNYREKRKETLESLGKKMAMKSVKTGKNCFLEPMNPYERRIIHTAVQDIEGAKSWSEGEDHNRHVVVGPVAGERYPRNRGGYGNRRNGGGFDRNNRRPQGNRPQGNRSRDNRSQSNSQYQPRDNRRPAPAQTAQKPRVDDSSAQVYGKIEKK